MKLSPTTIRFRLWQLRRDDPDITQIAAAARIGICRDTLRMICPDGWFNRGGGRPAAEEIPSVDAFFESESKQRAFLQQGGY